ncbi:MAG: metallophosphoesterase [Thermoanaerobaculia bacterium]
MLRFPTVGGVLRLALVLATLLFVAACASTGDMRGADRVVAVGDIHGDYDNLVAILEAAGLVDSKARWSGGRATLVITGDFFDRGPDVRRVLDLLMKLEREASRRRGRVVVLLGNHEAINLAYDLPYVSNESLAAFADGRSQKRREAAWRDYVEIHERLAERYGEGALKVLTESEWMKERPPGYLEYQEAISAQGKYGRWLRSKSAIAKIGDTVFVHGGLTPEAAELGIELLNSRIRAEIDGVDRVRSYLVDQGLILPFFSQKEVHAVVDAEAKLLDEASEDLRRVVTAYGAIYQWMLYDAFGPLWFRGYGEWSDQEGEEKIEAVLQHLGARRIVVGHTIPPDPSNILPRFGGRVFMIDTGMLRGYVENGRPSALEIRGDDVTAIYENGRVALDSAGDSSTIESRSRRKLELQLAAAMPLAVWLDAQALTAPERLEEPRRMVWRGPDESILPFATFAEVSEFLRSSKLKKTDRKRLGGVTKPQRLLVENGGVRARAVFRSVHREGENERWESGDLTEFLRDSWKSEIAAYELAVLLEVDRVPPTVPWRMKKADGSLQLWIEKARTGWHPQDLDKPADPELWQRHLDSMRVFDALIANIDRHVFNMLVDSVGRMWWIDHTRAFGRDRELSDAASIKRCERRLWDAIRTADPEEIAATLAPYMGEREIDALLERREKLVAHLQGQIDEHGEEAVLFTIGAEEALFAAPANSEER